MPESRQRSRTRRPARPLVRQHLEDSSTRPPAGVNLMALDSTLTMARCRWPVVARATTTPPPQSCTSTSTRPRPASGGSSSTVCCTSSPRRTSCAVDVQAAGLDPVEHEQVLDQPPQPGAVAVDDAEHRALPGRELAGVAVLQQLEVAADRGQRRAQLVADRRQEVGLLPVQPLQPLDVVPLVGLVLGLHQDAGGERGDLLDRIGLGPGPPAWLVHRQHEDDAEHAVTEPDRDHDHRPGAGLGGEDAGPFLRLHLRVQEVVDGQAARGAPQLLGQLADVGRELVRNVAEGCQGADVPLRAAQHPVLPVDGVGHDPVHAQALAEHRAEHVQGALDVGRPAQRPLHVQGQLVHHQALGLLEVQALVVLQQPVEVRGQVTDLGDLLVLPRAQVPLPPVLAGDHPMQAVQRPGQRTGHPPAHEGREQHRHHGRQQDHHGVEVQVVDGRGAPGVPLLPAAAARPWRWPRGTRRTAASPGRRSGVLPGR